MTPPVTFTGQLKLALAASDDPRLTGLSASRDDTPDRVAGRAVYPYVIVHEGISDARMLGSSNDSVRWSGLTQVDLYQSREQGSEDVGLPFAVAALIEALPQWRAGDAGLTYRATVQSSIRAYDPATRVVVNHLTVRIVRATRGIRR